VPEVIDSSAQSDCLMVATGQSTQLHMEQRLSAYARKQNNRRWRRVGY
jgi:hypothetical protein